MGIFDEDSRVRDHVVMTAPYVVQSNRGLHRSALTSSPRLWFVMALSMLLGGCAQLAPVHRSMTYALTDTQLSPLGNAAVPLAERHPGQSGVIGIDDGRIAFSVRALLARAATRSIDVQTFMWRADATGTLLVDEMLGAAERGVRVRLLLDDANTVGLDPLLAMLTAQPNIELRLYNPFASRSMRALGMLCDFERLNRRMHNKSFTVDNQVTIVGGRNIADEYFEAGRTESMADFDVLAIGSAVPGVSAEFDLYWNSGSAYPAKPLLTDAVPLDRRDFARSVAQVRSSATAAAYVEAIARTPQVRQLLDGTLAFDWANVRVVHDDPAKTIREPGTPVGLLLPELLANFGTPEQRIDLVSPYFVPGDAGAEMFASWARRGVRVRIMTNSLAATDVFPVHAGYARHRAALLQAGVALYEFRPGATVLRRRAGEIDSSSTAGLHAKTLAVDQRRIFVGSFNLDPRSAQLNTEMGLIIDSPALASRLADVLDKAWPELAYRVTLDRDARLEWRDGPDSVLTSEPETGWWRRLLVRISSWLPIEWLL